MDISAQPFDVSSMEFDQSNMLTPFNALVGSDPALRSLTMDAFFKFDGTDEDEEELTDVSTAKTKKSKDTKSSDSSSRKAAAKATASDLFSGMDSELGDFNAATDMFSTASFLSNLELPGAMPGILPMGAPFGAYDFNSHALDMLAAESGADSLILPNYVQSGMVSLQNLSLANSLMHNKLKPKRKYTKRKSSDDLSPEGKPIKKRTLSKQSMSSPAASGSSTGPKSPKKALAKHSSMSGPYRIGEIPDFISSSSVEIKPIHVAQAAPKSPKKALVKKASSIDAGAKQTSSFRGVSCCGKDRKWQARIRDANRVRYLGRFGTEVEAAFVYDEAARTLKGERAPTNFVKLDESEKERLVAGFVENNYSIPDSMAHLVVRNKAKNTSSERSTASSPIAASAPKAVSGPVAAAFSSMEDSFPDSPVAKLKQTGNSPAISPTMKTAATRAAPFSSTPKTVNRIKLDSNPADFELEPATQGLANIPLDSKTIHATPELISRPAVARALV